MNNHYYKKLNKRNDIYLFKIVSLSDKSVTIQININNFRLNDGQVIKRYTLKDDEGKEEDEIGLIKYDIYLENIKEKYYNNDKLTKLEKYMLMLKLRKREELLEVSKGDKNMSEVYKKLDDLSKDKYYALLYDEEEKKAYENKCILEDAIEDAKENGYSSGYNSGYDSGKSDGISNEKIFFASTDEIYLIVSYVVIFIVIADLSALPQLSHFTQLSCILKNRILSFCPHTLHLFTIGLNPIMHNNRNLKTDKTKSKFLSVSDITYNVFNNNCKILYVF